jgi:hypothetical protein
MLFRTASSYITNFRKSLLKVITIAQSMNIVIEYF